ncbi:MAG TPA: hypothetical protein VH157_06900 [Bryobacteraceae bacterium]|jgi:hypothetical protein|nr:hypothetical protein [Bryobacteraceae bacterium]
MLPFQQSETEPEPEPRSAEYRAFHEFAELTTQKRELKDELERIEKALANLEPLLLDYLGENGYESVRIGGYTIKAQRLPWVYPIEGATREMVITALKAAGLEKYVKENYSTQSLTKYISDLEEEYANELRNETMKSVLEIVPAPLAEVIELKPAYVIHATKK